MNVINIIEEGDYQKLFNIFNEEAYSNNVVAYMRLITSGEIRKNSIPYQDFIINQSPSEFCCKVKIIIYLQFKNT